MLMILFVPLIIKKIKDFWYFPKLSDGYNKKIKRSFVVKFSNWKEGDINSIFIVDNNGVVVDKMRAAKNFNHLKKKVTFKDLAF